MQKYNEMNRFRRFFYFFLALFMLSLPMRETPAVGALTDICKSSSHAPAFLCSAQTKPANFVDCGRDSNGIQVWCPQHSTNSSSRSSARNTALFIAGGVVFAGLMWYIFSMPSSENIDGQVRFAAF